MSEHTFEYNVTMSCDGCSKAVTRVLGKLDGIKTYDVNLGKQSATVVTADDSLQGEKVFNTIANTGKKITKFWEDGEEQTLGKYEKNLS